MHKRYFKKIFCSVVDVIGNFERLGAAAALLQGRGAIPDCDDEARLYRGVRGGGRPPGWQDCRQSHRPAQQVRRHLPKVHQSSSAY